MWKKSAIKSNSLGITQNNFVCQMLQWMWNSILIVSIANKLLKTKHCFSQWYLQYNGNQNVKLTEWIKSQQNSQLVQNFMAGTMSPLRASNHTRFTLSKHIFGSYYRKMHRKKVSNPKICRGHAGMHMKESDQILKAELKDRERQGFCGTFWVPTMKCDWSLQSQIWNGLWGYSRVGNICFQTWFCFLKGTRIGKFFLQNIPILKCLLNLLRYCVMRTQNQTKP